MNFGFVKAAACTPEIIVADCSHNSAAVLSLMREAAQKGAQLAVFTELCLTGYTCGDLFHQPLLPAAALSELLRLVQASESLRLVTVVGLPLEAQGKLYNCAAVFSQGKLLGIVPKSEIPNYGEFYELRHFTPAPPENGTLSINGQEVPFGTKLLFECSELPAFRIAIEICEDLWVCQPPSVRHAIAGATIIANLSASDEIIGKDAYRRQLVSSQSSRLVCGYLYADAGEGESTTDLVFAGHNLIAQNGKILAEAAPFGSGFCLTEIDVEEVQNERRRMNTYPPVNMEDYQVIPFSLPLEPIAITRAIPRNPFVPVNDAILSDRCEKILAIQSAGLRKRIAHVGAKSVVIGVSGGLDSTLALLVCVRAMRELNRPASDIIAITMPSFGTTRRTKNNAVKLCESLGVTLRTIDITASVKSHFRDLGHDVNDHSIVFENAQARERTQVLMDVSHQHGGFVVGTGDLSELALGWATYNGDHMSMYGVNASIPKTLVRFLVGYYAQSAEDKQTRKVLNDILVTPVSPELLPAKEGKISQLTESIIGPYELHDFFLYYLIRKGFSPTKIAWLAEIAFEGDYDAATIQKWLKVFLRRFFNNQFKRSCLPDGPKVGTVSLSPRGDWRMPSDASAILWMDDLN